MGFVGGVCFVAPAFTEIPKDVNLDTNKYWKNVQRRDIKLAVIGGLVGAIIVPICFTL
jgi:hypothetical protein